jgi:hypothetical protein
VGERRCRASTRLIFIGQKSNTSSVTALSPKYNPDVLFSHGFYVSAGNEKSGAEMMLSERYQAKARWLRNINPEYSRQFEMPE